jgi:hypothetical protein
VGTLVHSSTSGLQNVDTIFFMLRWTQYGFHEMYVGTRYVALLFLHPVGYAGHAVHSSASRALLAFLSHICASVQMPIVAFHPGVITQGAIVKSGREGPTVPVQLRGGLRSPNRTVTPTVTTTVHMAGGATCIDNAPDTSLMAMLRTLRCRTS